MAFRIYDTFTKNILLFEDVRLGVPVVNGVFEVSIGSTCPTDCTGDLKTVIQGGAARWLEIEVDGKLLSPLQRLTASPYALAVASGISVSNLAAGAFPAGDYSIDSGGRLGLGKIPGYPLDVAGDININAGSTLRIGGDPAVFSNWTVNGSSINRMSNVGISTGNPQYALDVVGDINLTGQLRQNDTPAVFSNWAVNVLDIYRMSKVGISTGVPQAALDVNGDAAFGSGVAKSSFNAAGNLYMAANSGIYHATMTLTTAGGLVVGAGTGKLDVGTVDPAYNIGGKKYATYMAGMVGVKEEATGLVDVTEEVPGVGYRAVIDFKKEPRGSDLWVFSRATNLKEQINRMAVLLSPNANTAAWWRVDDKNYVLTIYTAVPAKVAYRLTAPRFDAASWTNLNTTPGTKGFVLDDWEW